MAAALSDDEVVFELFPKGIDTLPHAASDAAPITAAVINRPRN
jgi:hypothetical protein